MADALAARDCLALSNLTTTQDTRCFADDAGGFCAPADRVDQDLGVICREDGTITVFGALDKPAAIRLAGGAVVPATPDLTGVLQLPVPGQCWRAGRS